MPVHILNYQWIEIWIDFSSILLLPWTKLKMIDIYLFAWVNAISHPVDIYYVSLIVGDMFTVGPLLQLDALSFRFSTFKEPLRLIFI